MYVCDCVCNCTNMLIGRRCGIILKHWNCGKRIHWPAQLNLCTLDRSTIFPPKKKRKRVKCLEGRFALRNTWAMFFNQTYPLLCFGSWRSLLASGLVQQTAVSSFSLDSAAHDSSRQCFCIGTACAVGRDGPIDWCCGPMQDYYQWCLREVA